MKKYFSKSLIAIEWALFLYVIIGVVASYLLPIPEIAKSLLSLPSWLIIPYFFGSFLKIVLRRLRFDSVGGRIEVGVFSTMFGIYSLIVFTFLLDLFGLSFILVNLYLVTLSIALVYLVYKTFVKINDDFLINISLFKTYLPIFSFCVLVSIIPAIMKVSVSGFPYGTVETISIPFEQTQPALRFMEYGYLQHPRIYDYVSLGIGSKLFNVDPLSFVWGSPFLMMAIFSFGLFLFSYTISKNKSLALLTVFIGSFLNMNIFRDVPVLFRANIILYALLPLTLYLSYKNITKKEYRMKEIIPVFVAIGFIAILYVYLFESNIWSVFVPKNLAYPREWESHVWIPIVTITTAPVLLITGYFSRFFAGKNNFLCDNSLLFLFIPFFFLAFQEIESIAFIFFIFAFMLLYFAIRNKKTRWILYLSVIFVFAFVLYQHFVAQIAVFNPISSLILPSYSQSPDIMPFSLRFRWLFDINLTLTLSTLLIFGVAISVFSKRRGEILAAAAFLMALFFYLFPESYAYRFYKELSVVMAFAMAIGVWRILAMISGSRKKLPTFMLSAIVVILLFPSLIAPVYTRYYQSNLGQSIVSSSEYSTAQWLKQNTPENTILVSDFETMELMAALSNRMLPIDRNYIVSELNTNSIQTLRYIKNMFAPVYFNYSLENASEPQFWNVYSFGKGSIEIRNDNITQINNNAPIDIVEGNKSVAGVLHRFKSEQNWSNTSGLYLSWYGKNTNSIWQICVSAPDDSNWFSFYFKDNFVGWANISAPLNAFSEVGAPNWSNVSYIAVRTSSALPNNWTLGDIGLNYITSLNINSDDVKYFKNNMTSTEQRYNEKVGLSMDNTTVLIILTSRTIQWVQQEGISQTVSVLSGPLDTGSLQLFNKVSCLQQIYSENNETYVFEIK